MLYVIIIAKYIDHIIDCLWILKIKIAILMNTISLLSALVSQIKKYNSYLYSHLKCGSHQNVEVYHRILKKKSFLWAGYRI